MDVLSNVLRTVQMGGQVFCRTELTSPWAVELPPIEGTFFRVIDRGEARIRLPDGGEPIRLGTGDVFFFPRSRAHIIGSDLGSLSTPLMELLRVHGPGSGVLHYGCGGELATVICGVFQQQDGTAHTLFPMLPSIVHIKASERKGGRLETTLQLMSIESLRTDPGAQTVLNRLTDVLFIQAVRAWLDSSPPEGSGWLAALRDPEVGAAIGYIHQMPEKLWTVASLAGQISMSRSAFAAKFTALVGEGPVQYLTRWRMQLAMNRLVDSGMSLAEIAEHVGYQSEVPFSKAFKREVGLSPGSYRREARSQANGVEIGV